ncbi:hypothetical protein FACS189431_7950 [Alphaproteobacteria bacterium]|nr:hypothetical protein FACS189431_7950 [Alphaproteobacteria bacterium]
MKRVGLMIMTLVLALASMPVSVFAINQTDIEAFDNEATVVEPRISEVFLGGEPYVEIYFESGIDPGKLADYYIATSTQRTPTKSGDFQTNINPTSISEIDQDSYQTFAIPSNSLNNPTSQRYVWLCDKTAVTSRLLCVDKYVDFVSYSHITDISYSMSRRDWNDTVLELSKPTPNDMNNFNMTDPDDETGGSGGSTTDDEDRCAFIQFNEISFSEPQKFIEIINPMSKEINLGDCTLRRGTSGDKEEIVMEGILPPGQVTSFDLEITNFKLDNNSFNIHVYDTLLGKNVVTLAYKAKSGRSYAFIAQPQVSKDDWYHTYKMTPGQPNEYQEFPTCEAGKHLSSAGNCVKDPDPPAECAEGQFRNPATGRCKKIAETTLSECAEGQFRNPATNRCKKIASDDDLVPCAEGYERNPDTNRCRKVVAGEDARFGVGPTDPGSGGNDVWIWAGIGGAALVTGLIGWQFHPEIGRGLRRMADFVKRPRGGA